MIDKLNPNASTGIGTMFWRLKPSSQSPFVFIHDTGFKVSVTFTRRRRFPNIRVNDCCSAGGYRRNIAQTGRICDGVILAIKGFRPWRYYIISVRSLRRYQRLFRRNEHHAEQLRIGHRGSCENVKGQAE